MEQRTPKIPVRALLLSWAWAMILVAVSAGTALAFNSMRDRGIPLFRRAPFDLYTDCPELAGEIPEITIKELPENDKKVVYVDSRMAPSHLKESIPGALFMPMYPINLPDFAPLKAMPKGTWIVVYGSKKLQNNKRLVTALMLKEVRGVHLLKGGLPSWKKAGRKTITRSVKYLEPGQIPKNALFVDTREEDDFLEGQLKGAVNIPLDTALPPDEKKVALLKKSNRPIVIYDSGETVEDERPAAPGVYADLFVRGVTNLAVARGGLKALQAAGHKPVQEAKEEEE